MGKEIIMKRLVISRLLLICLFFCPMYPLKTQWVNTGGPKGGAISAIASSGSLVYAGTVYKGIYRSTNGGIDWQPTSEQNAYVPTIITISSKILAGHCVTFILPKEFDKFNR